ncbi:hypothetical protein GO755_04650 [Spirosoma sp. HMF4905]|uniref:ACT domain-containing protein n=1 Tax=Spirosoma arboris TaxID=2682092 RepID=A0A7K1S667_9BACT|nr:hypothetical protein [Spirosoma arboris]MVM29312.1 hypothetical protein [Spirosoma arboris]
MTPTPTDTLVLEESTGRQIIVNLLGFDRLGLANDVLNAVRLDGRTWFQGIRFESDGVRSEGHIRLGIDRAETIDILLQRLNAITGLVRITQALAS